MAITAQHPSVLQLTKTDAALIDPTLPESSDDSRASMTRMMADRKTALTLAIFGGFSGLVAGTLLREWAFETFAIPVVIGTVLGFVLVGGLTAGGLYPFYARKDRLDKRLQAFANGPHAINIEYLNDSGWDATDDTPSVELWRVATAYRSVTETAAELRKLGGRATDASTELRSQLAAQLDALDAQLSAADLTLETANYREQASL